MTPGSDASPAYKVVHGDNRKPRKSVADFLFICSNWLMLATFTVILVFSLSLYPFVGDSVPSLLSSAQTRIENMVNLLPGGLSTLLIATASAAPYHISAHANKDSGPLESFVSFSIELSSFVDYAGMWYDLSPRPC